MNNVAKQGLKTNMQPPNKYYQSYGPFDTSIWIIN